MKTETKTKMFSKIEIQQKLKERITRKTVTETELSFETEISLVGGQTEDTDDKKNCKQLTCISTFAYATG